METEAYIIEELSGDDIYTRLQLEAPRHFINDSPRARNGEESDSSFFSEKFENSYRGWGKYYSQKGGSVLKKKF